MNPDDVWASDGVFTFPIQADVVLKHLREDMKDDWFKDAIHYGDLLSNTRDLQGVLSRLLDESNGQYVGAHRQICDIPKKGLGIRYALETDFYDRFIYQALCSFLIKYYDPLISHRVLSHRFIGQTSRERYLFKNRIDLWRTFEGITYTAISGNKALVATDLTNYYENISIESVRSAFLNRLPNVSAAGSTKLKIRNAIETLCALLSRWGYSDLHGLPQNRDASSFIANVVLSDVDHQMAALGHDYYRYVDDIRIICESPQAARKALMDLIGLLRTAGMNINSAKTAILTQADTEAKISEFFPAMDSRSISIDTMWRSRSRRVILRSVPLVCQLIEDLLKSKDTQSRQFRFAINRFIMLLDHGALSPSDECATGLAELLVNSLEEHAVSTDQFCKFLSLIQLSESLLEKIESFLANPMQSIHPWQNYHLWMLLAMKGRKTDSLVELARKKIQESISSPEMPAIFIYASAVGTESVLIAPVIDRFDSGWPYQHQRCFLFAARRLPENLLRPIVSKLNARTAGTLRRAESYLPVDGKPLVARSDLRLIDIYDEISPYV